MDLDDRVARVVLAAEELRQLERADVALDLVHLRAELGEPVRIALDGQLEEDLRLLEVLAELLPAPDRPGDRGRLAADRLGARGVVPEAGGGGLLGQGRGAAFEGGEVKGASRAR
jgi:hypothetical protein